MNLINLIIKDINKVAITPIIKILAQYCLMSLSLAHQQLTSRGNVWPSYFPLWHSNGHPCLDPLAEGTLTVVENIMLNSLDFYI